MKISLARRVAEAALNQNRCFTVTCTHPDPIPPPKVSVTASVTTGTAQLISPSLFHTHAALTIVQAMNQGVKQGTLKQDPCTQLCVICSECF